MQTPPVFKEVAKVLEAHGTRIDNHSKQLANQLELIAGLSTMFGVLKQALEAQQKIFEALQRAVAEKAGGEAPPPPDEPIN